MGTKLVFLLKVSIFSGLALLCLSAHAEEEYAAIPSADDCHYAENPIIRETVHRKYRHVAHHRAHHVTHRYRSPSGLVAYYPFMNGCNCDGSERTGYVLTSVSSDELRYNLMNDGPLYEGGSVEGACDH